MEESSPPGAQDRPIHDLKAHVAEFAELALAQVTDGARAFLGQDPGLAAGVTDRDILLDERDVQIETETIRLIAMLQPEGADLRTLGAILKIANSVDRVGRLGYDLAELESAGVPPADPTPLELIGRMDQKARAMVQEAIRAFVDGDADRAKRVFALDDEVDAVHREVQARVFQRLHEGGPATDRLARALLAARHLERVGDNACKIAEKTVYAVTGERRPEYFPKRIRKARGAANPP